MEVSPGITLGADVLGVDLERNEIRLKLKLKSGASSAFGETAAEVTVPIPASFNRDKLVPKERNRFISASDDEIDDSNSQSENGAVGGGTSGQSAAGISDDTLSLDESSENSAGAVINARSQHTIPQKRPRNSKVTGVARPPYASHKKFNTTRYKRYDHDNPQTLHLRLPILNNIGEIPTRGVRIDDLTLSRVLGKWKDLQLNARWPADIDMKGMVRARRMPLGRAAKMWVTAGDVDIDGNVMGVGDEGYYYKWWLGLHCLMRHEGFRAGRYLQRPSHEEDLCPGFAFKKGYKAVIQEPEDR